MNVIPRSTLFDRGNTFNNKIFVTTRPRLDETNLTNMRGFRFCEKPF